MGIAHAFCLGEGPPQLSQPNGSKFGSGPIHHWKIAQPCVLEDAVYPSRHPSIPVTNPDMLEATNVHRCAFPGQICAEDGWG